MAVNGVNASDGARVDQARMEQRPETRKTQDTDRSREAQELHRGVEAGRGESVAARAAIAAQQQPGKYFAFHNAMMEHRGQLPEAEVLRIAKASGLDVAKLKADMAAPRVTEVIERNLALATKLGIQGTDRKSTRLNSSHNPASRMPSSA
jgi:2-hydroxychromene-2-carboxylate isomerase